MGKNYKILLSVVNILLYLVVIALWIAIPSEVWLNLSVTVLSLVLTGLYAFLNRHEFIHFYSSPIFKKFTESLIFILLIFSILGLLNYWAFKHPLTIDWSLYKMNSMTEQSKNILKKLDKKLKFTILARGGEIQAWYALAEFYRNEKSDIEIEKIDIDVRPDIVQSLNIGQDSSMLIEYADKREIVTIKDELNVTNGIIKVSRSHNPVIYFLTGHNENSTESKDADGLNFIYSALINSSLDIRPINLTSTQEIPFDAKMAILWGPKKELMKTEIAVLEKFLKRGGRLLIGIDPDLNQDHSLELKSFLMKKGLIVHNNFVIDKKSFVNGSDGTIPLVENFNRDHPLTRDLKGQVFFPFVSSMEEIKSDSEKMKVEFLMNSNPFPLSWGESSLDEVVKKNIEYTPVKDLAGPLNLAASLSDDQSKLVVFSNSTFVHNAYMKYGSNYALFINAVNFLSDEGRLISFNLPIIQAEPIFISGPMLGTIFYFSVVFSPLILLGTALFMYRKRRVQ